MMSTPVGAEIITGVLRVSSAVHNSVSHLDAVDELQVAQVSDSNEGLQIRQEII